MAEDGNKLKAGQTLRKNETIPYESKKTIVVISVAFGLLLGVTYIANWFGLPAPVVTANAYAEDQQETQIWRKGIETELSSLGLTMLENTLSDRQAEKRDIELLIIQNEDKPETIDYLAQQLAEVNRAISNLKDEIRARRQKIDAARSGSGADG